jgi:hypothetical protein
MRARTWRRRGGGERAVPESRPLWRREMVGEVVTEPGWWRAGPEAAACREEVKWMPWEGDEDDMRMKSRSEVAVRPRGR